MVHTIKGISGTVGAIELNKQSLNLESAIKNNEIDQVPVLMSSYSEAVSRLMKAIDPLKTIKNEVVEPVQAYISTGILNKEKLKVVITELNHLIDEGKLDALQRLQQLKEEFGSFMMTEDILKLDTLLNNYDFDEARSVTHQISKMLGLDGTI